MKKIVILKKSLRVSDPQKKELNQRAEKNLNRNLVHGTNFINKEFIIIP